MEHRDPDSTGTGTAANPADIMERQQALNLTLPEAVAVVGCGGVGSWTAYFLALSGVKELWLFDHDTISESNLNRVLATPEDINKSKSKVVAELITKYRPSCKVLPMGRFSKELATALHLYNNCDWLVATTDTKASRDEVYQYASEKGVYFIEAAAEGEYGSATSIPGEWTTELENNPGYASVPVWVGPCVLAAVIAVNHVIHGRSMGDRTIRLGWSNAYNKFDVFNKDQEVEYVQQESEQN